MKFEISKKGTRKLKSQESHMRFLILFLIFCGYRKVRSLRKLSSKRSSIRKLSTKIFVIFSQNALTLQSES